LFAQQSANWATVFACLAALYAFRIANGLIKIAVMTATYYLTKAQRVSDTVAMLYKHKVPVNDDTMFADSTNLLETLVAAKDVNEETKRFALMSIGELNGLRLANRLACCLPDSHHHGRGMGPLPERGERQGSC
jgi:hypothetical protein